MTVVALVGVLLGVSRFGCNSKQGHNDPSLQGASDDTLIRFLLMLGMTLNAFFFLNIIVTVIPTFFVGVCDLAV
jgi:hypothetical protein